MNSPSRKGHKQNCQVYILQTFFWMCHFNKKNAFFTHPFLRKEKKQRLLPFNVNSPPHPKLRQNSTQLNQRCRLFVPPSLATIPHTVHTPKHNLVGGFNPSEKYKSNWESSPNRGENKKYLKPPTSNTRISSPFFRRVFFFPFKTPHASDLQSQSFHRGHPLCESTSLVTPEPC